MEELFLHLLNMSLSATPLILAVMLLRLLMKRSPRWILCLLWAAVAVRLLCPVTWESPLGLMPSQPPVTGSQINGAFSEIVLPQIQLAETETALLYREPVPETVSLTQIAALVWAIGVGVMGLYLLVSCLRLRYLVREAVPQGSGVWLCDAVKTPFILGGFRPRIYLPSGIREEDRAFVIAHERAHLKRKDHLWKPLAFLLLAVYWFHPLLWAAYAMLSKDIELACDERVIRDLSLEGKKAYSLALLECSTSRKAVLACPVAFGEVAIKERIQNILKYRKPALWIVVLSVVLVLAGTGCFMTAKPQEEESLEIPAFTEPEETVLTEREPAPAASGTETVAAEPSEEWSGYPDGIRIESYVGETFTAQVMLVRDPARVTLGASSDFKSGLPGRRLEEVMEENGVTAAINAGEFFDDGTSSEAVGATPVGLVYSGGSCLWEQGEPRTSGFAGFTQDHILVVHNSALTRKQAEELKIRDGCSFGPALIVNGEINREAYYENSGYNPRTAIGQRADGSVIFVCINGRQAESLGGTYGDLTDILVEYGAVSACNMTGGSATGMMYRDSYGALGKAGEVLTLTTYPMGQPRARRLPTHWLVRTGD